MQWTAIRGVMSNDNLTGVGVARGLDDCVMLNPGTTQVSSNTMATTVQAILGAVHVDDGDVALARVMVTLGLIHDLLQAVTYILALFEQLILYSNSLDLCPGPFMTALNVPLATDPRHRYTSAYHNSCISRCHNVLFIRQ